MIFSSLGVCFLKVLLAETKQQGSEIVAIKAMKKGEIVSRDEFER